MHRLKNISIWLRRDTSLEKQIFVFCQFWFHFRNSQINVVPVAVCDNTQLVGNCLVIETYYLPTVVYCPIYKTFPVLSQSFQYLAIVALPVPFVKYFQETFRFFVSTRRWNPSFVLHLRKCFPLSPMFHFSLTRKKKILIGKKKLYFSLQYIANGLITNEFLINRIRNVKQLWNFFIFIFHRGNLLKFCLFLLFCKKTVFERRNFLAFLHWIAVQSQFF